MTLRNSFGPYQIQASVPVSVTGVSEQLKLTRNFPTTLNKQSQTALQGLLECSFQSVQDCLQTGALGFDRTAEQDASDMTGQFPWRLSYWLVTKLAKDGRPINRPPVSVRRDATVKYWNPPLICSSHVLIILTWQWEAYSRRGKQRWEEKSKQDWWGTFTQRASPASAEPLELRRCQGFMCYKYEKVFDVKVVWQWQTATCPAVATQWLIWRSHKAKMIINRPNCHLSSQPQNV